MSTPTETAPMCGRIFDTKGGTVQCAAEASSFDAEGEPCCLSHSRDSLLDKLTGARAEAATLRERLRAAECQGCNRIEAEKDQAIAKFIDSDNEVRELGRRLDAAETRATAAERQRNEAYALHLQRSAPISETAARLEATAARLAAAEGERDRLREERDGYRAKAWTRFELLQAAGVDRDRLRDLLARLLKFAEYMGDIANEMGIVQPEDEKAEGGILAACRTALAAIPHTEVEASAPPKETT